MLENDVSETNNLRTTKEYKNNNNIYIYGHNTVNFFKKVLLILIDYSNSLIYCLIL
jgi:hypothetical protein